MNITRISKTGDLKDYFQSFFADRLSGPLNMGYEKWHWKYIENPFFSGHDLPAWVCTSEDAKTAGHLGAIPAVLKAGEQKINAAWAVDFIILPEYRRKGLGMALVKEANQHFDAFLAIGGTDMSSNLFTKMGWILLGYVPYYIKVLDLKALFKYKIKNLLIRIILLMAVSPYIKICNYLKRPVEHRDIKIRVIDSFDEGAELFWKEIEHFYKIIIPRDKAYLNWKYDAQPGMHYVKFRADRNNRLCGYIVVRVIKTGASNAEGLIADIIAKPDDKNAVNALILAALNYFKSENCLIARCSINDKNIEKVIAGCGFIKRRPQMRFLIKKNLDGLENIYKLEDWHITAGDSDIDR